MTGLHWYIIAINVAAFVIYTIDFQIYVHGGEGIKPQVLCNLVTICGGAFGTLIAEVLWDPKVSKNRGNVQSRIYSLVCLVFQGILFWAILGPNHEKAKEFAQAFCNSHKPLCFYYATINILTFIMFAIDKIKAILKKSRIREMTLLGLCLIGGGVGGLLAMDLCNHKINFFHMYFVVGVPLMICVHMFLLICIAIGVF